MKQQLPSVSAFRANMYQQQGGPHSGNYQSASPNAPRSHSGNYQSHQYGINEYGSQQSMNSPLNQNANSIPSHHAHSYGSNRNSNHFNEANAIPPSGSMQRNSYNSYPMNSNNTSIPSNAANEVQQSPMSASNPSNNSNPSPPRIAGAQNAEKKWSKKKKRITNPSQHYARMEVAWNFVTDFGDEGHHILLKHIQDPQSDTTERLLYLDGEEVVNERTNDLKFELDIGDDEVDVVIQHNAELTRYDYLLFINDTEYGDKVQVTSKRTTGTKGKMVSKPISAAELKKKDPKRWAERNRLKVEEQKEREKKTRKRPKDYEAKASSGNAAAQQSHAANRKKVEKKWGFVGFGPFGKKKKKKEKVQRSHEQLDDEQLPSEASSPRMQQNPSSTSEIWQNGPPQERQWNGAANPNAINPMIGKADVQSGQRHHGNRQNEFQNGMNAVNPVVNPMANPHNPMANSAPQQMHHPAQLHQSQVVTDEWEDTESEYETDSQEDQNQQYHKGAWNDPNGLNAPQHAKRNNGPGQERGHYGQNMAADSGGSNRYRQPEPGSVYASAPIGYGNAAPQNGIDFVQHGMQQMGIGHPQQRAQYGNMNQGQYAQQHVQSQPGRQHHGNSNVSSVYNENAELKKEDESSSSYGTDKEEW